MTFLGLGIAMTIKYHFTRALSREALSRLMLSPLNIKGLAMQLPSNPTFQTERSDSPICTEPKIAKLVEGLGYQFLMESLQLEDEIFEIIFLSRELEFVQRQCLLAHVQTHFAQCAHCQIINQRVVEEDKHLEEEFDLAKEWYMQSKRAKEPVQ